MRSGFIYRITCAANGAIYIGSTIRTLKQRWSEHLWYLRRKQHHSKRLQACFDRYGEQSLCFEMAERVEDAVFVVGREQFHIWRTDPLLLMNSAPVSDATYCAALANTGRVQSAEERAMRSQALLSAKITHEWSDDRRRKHSIALTGRKMPAAMPERGRKISAAKKGVPRAPEAVAAWVASRQAYIASELPGWLALKAEGKSYREIERITGRCRRVIARECARAGANG